MDDPFSLEPSAPDPLDSILTSDDHYLKLRSYPEEELKASEIILKLRRSKANVLIIGPTGTGKELIAKAIHGPSDRPLVSVNTAGIPETLLEAEFFGANKGAYTGSHRDRPGYFEQANTGTIFLDEIGELPPLMQCKLLRVLQERRVRRIGSEKEIELNFRVIAATNQENLNRSQTFREDLYYRLATVVVQTVPLHRRPYNDLKLLIRRLDTEERITDTKIKHWQTLYCPWPGNVRQLENLTTEYLTFFED